MRGGEDRGVSVLLCTYNRRESLARCLASLLALEPPTDRPWEIVVVDDGSTDGTADHLDRLATTAAVPMRHVDGPGRGIAAARNCALEAAAGGWVAFCDDDQVVYPGWLRALLATAERHAARVVVGRRVLVVPAGVVIREARLRTWLGEELWGREERPLEPAEEANTGNVLARRELLVAAGGFDEAMVEGGEDTLLFHRLRAAGEPLWVAPEATLEHHPDADRCTPSYLLWRARRSGRAEARIRRRVGGAPALWGGLLRWALVAAVKLLRLPLIDPPDSLGPGLYHRYVLVHAWGYIRYALGDRRPGPPFRERAWKEEAR